MGRQRFIHPEFWSDPTIGQLTVVERLFFIGCFSNADDEGRLLGNPAYLRSVIFPYDDLTITQVKDIREQAIAVCRNLVLYEIEGVEYLAFMKWFNFQKPKYPQPSKIPPPPGVETKSANTKWYVSKALKQKILEKYNYSCVACGTTENLEIDHKIPLKHGGTSDEENLQVLCSACNNKKHDKLPEQLSDDCSNLEEHSTKLEQNSAMGWVGLGWVGLDRDGADSPKIAETFTPEPEPAKPAHEFPDLSSLPLPKQAGELVKFYHKAYPDHFKQYGTGGSIAANKTFLDALNKGVKALDIMFQIANWRLPGTPAPWDIAKPLLNLKRGEITPSELMASFEKHQQKEAAIGGDTS